MYDTQLFYCTKEIENTLNRRKSAVQRLRNFEFWIQIINVYYSCFTAIIAIIGLSENGSFLSVPSTLFTVTVAILVTYANSQKCGQRANDLQINCNDLQKNLTDLLLCKSDDEVKKVMDEFYKNLGDSETGSIIDEWKHSHKWKYKVFYIFPVTILIIAFFMVPILFFLINLEKFAAAL